jgi:hypothetical protein
MSMATVSFVLKHYPDSTIQLGTDSPTGSGFTDRIYSIFADKILSSRPDPDSPTEFIDRIRICWLDPDSQFWIWIHRLDPDLSTRSGFLTGSASKDRIRICRTDLDLSTGSRSFSDCIRIRRPDPDLPTPDDNPRWQPQMTTPDDNPEMTTLDDNPR